MQFATIRQPNGQTTAAVRNSENDVWEGLQAANLSELFDKDDWKAAAFARSGEVAGEIDMPLPTPAKVICCGLNYRNHILEMGRDLPKHPTLFAKYADALVGPGATISLVGSEKVDWEAELAVIVGAPLHRAAPEEAKEAIAGYTVANDISARDWQNRTLQWFQGKAWTASTPVGPIVVSADAFDPSAGANIYCSVNGETVQSATLDELVFDPAELLAYISTFTTLNPGDIVLTGTPGGVGAGMKPPRFLNDGDKLVTGIEGIGSLANTINIRNH